MDNFFRFLVQIGVPLFFLLSGMGSIYFETEKRGFYQYVKNKTQRLLSPFVFAVLVFLVPRLYISQGWETIGRLDKFTRQEWNIFRYYPQVLADDLMRRTGPLWFLPVLLVISLLNYPIIAWSRRRAKKIALEWEDWKIVIGQVLAIIIQTLLGYALVKNKYDFWNYIVPANIVLFFGMCVQFGFQVYVQNLKDDECSYVIWMMLFGPILSICLSFFKYTVVDKNFYGYVLMLNFHSNFFAQGVVNQIWREKLQQHSSQLSKTAAYPFYVVGAVMLYGINFPGNYNDVGYIFLYPIYGTPVMVSLFTTGTWQVIYGLEYIMKKEADHIYNENVFKFYTTGSLFIYLCHDLYITVIATYILQPNVKEGNPRSEGISIGWAIFIMIIGVEVLCNLTYYLLVKLYFYLRARNKSNSGLRIKAQGAAAARGQKLRSHQNIEAVDEAEEEEEREGANMSENIQDCGGNSDEEVEQTTRPDTQTKRTY